MSAEWPLQQAIYSALSGSAGVLALCSRIVDAGPRAEDAAVVFPFIEIGKAVLSEFDTDRENGFFYSLRIKSISNSGSSMQSKQIQGAIYVALHRQDLTVAGWNHLLISRHQSFVDRSTSGAFHGVCEYRGLIRQT